MKHIFAQEIIQDGANHVNCPTCRKDCELTAGGADSLPNNFFALHIFYLDTGRDQRIADLEDNNNDIISTNTAQSVHRSVDDKL